MKNITAIIAFGLITFSSFGQWSDTSTNQTLGGLKLKSYLLLDADGDFTGGNYFTIQDDPQTNNLRIGYGFSNHFTMNSSGNIGFGTTTPGAQLELNGGSLLLKGRNNDAGDLIFRTNTATQLGRIWTNTSGISGLYLSSGDNIADLTVSQSGNVGIGTSSPDSKLAVNGKIHTKEVQVDLIGWSDFVFYDNYKLPTLLEVEKHIKEKGHLKDIPSAKEVEENGVLLGEMTSLLLQKIEELTLYTIEQEKRIKVLEGKID